MAVKLFNSFSEIVMFFSEIVMILHVLFAMTLLGLWCIIYIHIFLFQKVMCKKYIFKLTLEG